MTAKEIKNLSKNLKVLYVEDEQKIREQTHVFFEKFFEKVDTASNGEEGLDLFLKNEYDIVITDVVMPIMNGVDMLEQIRLTNRDVVTVIMSGISSGDKHGDAKSDYQLVKPVSVERLLNVLEQIVTLK